MQWTPSIHAAQQASRKLGPFERTILDLFELADADGNGNLDEAEFITIWKSPGLNLGLSEVEVLKLKNAADTDGDGMVSYREFVPICREMLVRVYGEREDAAGEDSNSRAPNNHWMELYSENEGWVYLNRVTGVATYEIPPEMVAERMVTENPLADALIEQFAAVAAQGKPTHAATETLFGIIESDESGVFLTEQEANFLRESVVLGEEAGEADVGGEGEAAVEAGFKVAAIADFALAVADGLKKFHEMRADHPRDWIFIKLAARAGMVWFNKKTSETRRDPPVSVLQSLHRLGSGHGQEAVMQHTSVVNSIDAEREAVLSELETLRALTTKPETKSEDVDRLKTVLAEARESLGATTGQRDLLAATLRTALDSDLQGAGLVAMEGTYSKLGLELVEAEAAHTKETQDLEAAIEDQKSQMAALNDRLVEQQDAVATSQQALDTLSKDIREAKKQKRLGNATAAGTETLTSLREKHEVLQREYAAVRAAMEDRTKMVRVVRQQLVEAQDKSAALKIKASESDALERKLIEITEAHATAKTFLLAKSRLLQAREDELEDLRTRVSNLETNSSTKDQAVKGMVSAQDGSLGFTDRAQSAEFYDYKTSPGKRRQSQVRTLPSIAQVDKGGAANSRRQGGGGGRRTNNGSSAPRGSAPNGRSSKVGGMSVAGGSRVFVQDRRSGEFRKLGVE
jgi:hypothetical protein